MLPYLRLKPSIAILCLAGLAAAPVFAANDSSAANPQIAQISSETKSLETQLSNLQKEVTSLKGQLHSKMARGKRSSSHSPASAKSSMITSNPGSGEIDAAQPYPMTGKQLVGLISQEREFLPFDLDVPGQAFVSTGPYVGVPIQFAGSDLIINSPSVNTDVQLLGIRKNIINQLHAMGGEIFKEPYHSHLLLSGLVETQANYTNYGGAPSTTNIDVTNVSLDAFFIGPSQWTLGFVEFSYDNSPPNGSPYTSISNYTEYNSRVYVNKAFFTVGDFTRTPWYGTMGQFYVPFGTYSSVMVSDPLTKLLTRTKARAIEVGYWGQDPNTFYGSAYIFRGDSHAASVDKINNGGVNLGFRLNKGPLNWNLGGGVIGNIADSGGMQIGNNFQQYEQISHRVPGYDVRGNFGFGNHWDFIAEYVAASTNFSMPNMSYNGQPAKPWALDTELAYSFTFLDDKPSAIAIGYAKTQEALALQLPLIRYSAVFSTSIFRNTLQSLELRHDQEYPASATATSANSTPVPAETGKADNAVTAQFDYYF